MSAIAVMSTEDIRDVKISQGTTSGRNLTMCDFVERYL